MKKSIKIKKIGRPQKSIDSVFPENWKELIIEWSCQGWTEAEIRAELCKLKGIFHLQLWYALKEREQEFSEALQICKVLRQAWWEKKARENLSADKFQTGLWYACMKNMFGYRDNHEAPKDERFQDAELDFIGIPKQKDLKFEARFKKFYDQN